MADGEVVPEAKVSGLEFDEQIGSGAGWMLVVDELAHLGDGDRLAAVKIGGRRRITHRALEDFVARLEAADRAWSDGN